MSHHHHTRNSRRSFFRKYQRTACKVCHTASATKPLLIPTTGIIGYSDDDRSDDELKRPKTLPTTKPKDGLQPRKAVASAATKPPNVVATSPIPNVSLIPNTVRPSIYGRGTPSVRPPPGSSMFRDRNQGFKRTLILPSNVSTARGSSEAPRD